MAGLIVDAIRTLDKDNTGLIPLKLLTDVIQHLDPSWDEEKLELLTTAAGLLSEGGDVQYAEFVAWVLSCKNSALLKPTPLSVPVRRRTKSIARSDLRDLRKPPSSITLRVLHINDVYDLTPLPRVRSAIQSLGSSPSLSKTIATMGGDFLAPYLLSNLDKGAGMVDCMNGIPISHCCFGNHECDVPHSSLLEAIDTFTGSWINSNMKGGGFGEIERLPTHEVLELVSQDGQHRRRVALLGLVTGEPHLYRHGSFNGAVPSIESVNDCCARLCAELTGAGGCDAVIPMTHQDSSDDIALAARGRELRVPLILGGHDHLEVVAPAPSEEACTYMKAGMDAVKIGLADITWDSADARWPTVEARLLDTMDFELDAGLQKVVEKHMAKVWAMEHMVACRRPDMEALTPPSTAFPLSSVGTRQGESSMATFLCSALREALACDVALLDGGSVRAGTNKYMDRVTMSDLKAELPFKNDTLVIQLPGAVLAEAVRASRLKAAEKPYAFFLHCDKDCAVDPGTHALLSAAGSPFDPDRVYATAVGVDLGIGAGVNEPLLEWAEANSSQLPDRELARPALELLEVYFVLQLWKHLPSFDEIDLRGDGFLHHDEIEQAYLRVFMSDVEDLSEAQRLAAKSMVDHLIRSLDVAKDNKVSREEYAALLAHRPTVQVC
ncbi:unnamed protein product [Prorocentrum cordatum]|uniref:EF-hand domain-containing protein n=1 Tax=Prorocentrum cordatum TaxID=2364126 RepID=A0ABN9XY21_9DINO|nr:unnamed protein product [Polarella glacialis]|mmetsp:Transcript_80919/g.229139  ORF Transcript_80919/g.229139 Transcript_80919/m.229139 type:complete len:666 (-) Transcript_80919:237-2234(-)